MTDRHLSTHARDVPRWPAMSRPSVLALAFLLLGCFSLDTSAPLSPPPVNPRISASDTPLVTAPRTANVTVACDGPAEEVESLGLLCGTGALDWKLVRVEGETTAGWGLALRDLDWDPEQPTRGLLLFVEHPLEASDLVGEASYAAYVGIAEPAQWGGADVVTRGRVHSEAVGDDACGPTWIGSAELYWRSTILLATWYVAPDC